jgi:peptide/nickel transport system permease protein
MLALIFRRLIQMALIMAVASLILFVIFDTEEFKKKIAVAELGGFAVSALSEESYHNWLAERASMPRSMSATSTGSMARHRRFGHSFEKNIDIGHFCRPTDQYRHPGVLVFALMILLSLVSACRHEGGSHRIRHLVHLRVHHLDPRDRPRSSSPCSPWVGWLPAKSAMIQGFD